MQQAASYGLSQFWAKATCFFAGCVSGVVLFPLKQYFSLFRRGLKNIHTTTCWSLGQKLPSCLSCSGLSHDIMHHFEFHISLTLGSKPHLCLNFTNLHSKISMINIQVALADSTDYDPAQFPKLQLRQSWHQAGVPSDIRVRLAGVGLTQLGLWANLGCNGWRGNS